MRVIMKFAHKLLDKLWPQPVSIFIFLTICLFGSIAVIPKSATDSIWPIIIYTIASIILLIIIILQIIKAYKLPKAKANSLAILFVINSENNKQFEEIKRKLISEFQELINKQKSTVFEALYIPRNRVMKLDLISEASQKKLLEDTRCTFLIRIKIDSNDIDSPEFYEITFNYGILHLQYKDEIDVKFKKELTNLTHSIRKQEYKNKNTIKVMKSASNRLAYICRYLFGVTFYLNGKAKEASIICEDLYAEIKAIKKNEPVINYLKHYLPFRCHEINMILTMRLYNKFLSTFKENDLDEFYDYLKKANIYISNTYIYYSFMSIYLFVKNRNIKESQLYVNKCKELSPNNTWKYSDAFLSAYKENSLLTTYRKYKNAFKVPYNLLDLSLFIEHILDIEPHKKSLHFALGLIYNEIGDVSLMGKHFNAFQIYIDGHSQEDKLITIIAKIINSNSSVGFTA